MTGEDDDDDDPSVDDVEVKELCEGVGEWRRGGAVVDREWKNSLKVEGSGARVGGRGKSRVVSERRRAKSVEGDSIKLSGSPTFVTRSLNVSEASGISRISGVLSDEVHDRSGMRGLGRRFCRGILTPLGSSLSARSPSSSSTTGGRSLDGTA